MRLVCLCLTYNHPVAVIENAIACFEAQSYRDAELLILDDSGLIPDQSGDRWRLVSVPDRFPSLPDKYDAAVDLLDEQWDALVVWEDDDVYLGWHLETYAAALAQGGWAHPSLVHSLFDDGLKTEQAAGRFHAALGITRELYDAVGGWRGTKTPEERVRLDFDQELMGRLGAHVEAVDPLDHRGPSYVYRWISNGTEHGSGFGGSEAAMTEWYAKVSPRASPVTAPLQPRFDQSTRDLRRELRLRKRLVVAPPKTTELTIGMATYDDYDGTYFTIQALRMYHDVNDVELLVIDNFGSDRTHRFLAQLPNTRYVRSTERTGTAAPRNLVFQEAAAELVVCCDSHVLFLPGAIDALRDYFRMHPDSRDLIQGPLVTDDLTAAWSHFADRWGDAMWGQWDLDPRAMDPSGDAFEIPMQGLGVFACRKDAWLGFSDDFREFGGEEGYIHEKFRQAGQRSLCLPAFRWVHRFSVPEAIKFPISTESKLRNYIVGFTELGLDLRPVLQHFAEFLPGDKIAAITADALRFSVRETNQR
ncbi:MAG: glycosyltransferase [Acidimicrobiales bacterium]|nr:glycosyltransferase [Acidimicrobiales bacterium]